MKEVIIMAKYCEIFRLSSLGFLKTVLTHIIRQYFLIQQLLPGTAQSVHLIPQIA